VSRKNLPEVGRYDPEYAVWLHWMHLCTTDCAVGESRPFFARNIHDSISPDNELLWDGNTILEDDKGTKTKTTTRYVAWNGCAIAGQDESRAVSSQYVWTFINRQIFKRENRIEVDRQLNDSMPFDIALTTAKNPYVLI